jgi:DNA-binding GntR family transcriptional regulator
MHATAPIPRPRALFEAIAESLRERIFNHELPPGSTLDECLLAKDMGVSRTPVREALKVLIRDGLVTHRNLSGCRVAEFSPTELAELLKTLEHLESFELERGGNPFAADAIQRMRDKLYLAVGPAFVESDHAALQALTARWHGGNAAAKAKHAALERYFSQRRLDVARLFMNGPAGPTANA